MGKIRVTITVMVTKFWRTMDSRERTALIPNYCYDKINLMSPLFPLEFFQAAPNDASIRKEAERFFLYPSVTASNSIYFLQNENDKSRIHHCEAHSDDQGSSFRLGWNAAEHLG